MGNRIATGTWNRQHHYIAPSKRFDCHGDDPENLSKDTCICRRRRAILIVDLWLDHLGLAQATVTVSSWMMMAGGPASHVPWPARLRVLHRAGFAGCPSETRGQTGRFPARAGSPGLMTRSRGPFVLRQAAVSPASLPSVGKKRKKRGQPELSDFLDSRRTLRRDSGLVLVTLRAHRRSVIRRRSSRPSHGLVEQQAAQAQAVIEADVDDLEGDVVGTGVAHQHARVQGCAFRSGG